MFSIFESIFVRFPAKVQEYVQELLSFKFKGDKYIWLATGFLIVLGIIMYYSNVRSIANNTNLGLIEEFFIFLKKHFLFAVTGVLFIYLIHHIDYPSFAVWAKLGVMFALILLILTNWIGVQEGNAMRKLVIPGIGSFQPAELAKIFVILDLATVLSEFSRGKKENFKIVHFYISILLSGIVMLLVMYNSNSAGLLLAGTLFGMIIISEVPKAAILKSLAFILAVIITGLVLTQRSRIGVFIERFEVFLNYDLNRKDGIGSPDIPDNDQQDLAIANIATAPFPFGKLPGHGENKAVLPLSFSDFVFSSVVEEFGLIFAIAIIGAYLLILYRSFRYIKYVKKYTGAYLVFGLATCLVAQAMVHIFVNTGISPVTGQTLPFISQGGTSLWTASIAIGMIQSVIRTDSPKV